LAIGLVLVGAILWGSSQTCERVFRLLRWAANRPEPPAPGQLTIPHLPDAQGPEEETTQDPTTARQFLM
jgi:hypothetical protein